MILNDAWNEILEIYGYPNLETPTIVDEDFTAFINMSSKEIFISKPFLKKLGLPLKTSLKGLLAHETGHYVSAPYDLKTFLLCVSEASKHAKNNPSGVANYYFDVVVNKDACFRGVEEISEVYQNMDLNNDVDNNMRALYSLVSKKDFGFMRERLNVNALAEFMQIDYEALSTEKTKENVREFSRIFMTYFEEHEDIPSKKVVFRVTDDEIRRALSEVAEELSPHEYGDLCEKYLSGKSQDNLVDFYRQLSDKYKIRIIDNKRGAGCTEKTLKEYEFSDEASSIDYFKSYGLVLPGISKVMKEKEIGEEKKGIASRALNDCLIIYDSSHSMVNPVEEKSPAVIGAFSIINTYADHKKKIGVINFSSDTIFYDYTESKDVAHANLLRRFGGYSELDTKKVGEALGKVQPDVYVISDLAINAQAKKYFSMMGKTLRVNIFHISPLAEIIPNCVVHTVSGVERIPNLINNTMREYLGVRQ